MVPPDGDRARRLPTLSWESVVDADAAPSEAGAASSDPVPPPQPRTSSPVPPPPPIAPLVAPSIMTTSDHGITVADPPTSRDDAPATWGLGQDGPLEIVTPIEPIEFAPLSVDRVPTSAPIADVTRPDPAPIEIPVDLLSDADVGIDAQTAADLPELHVELDLHTGSVDVVSPPAFDAVADRVRTEPPSPIIPAFGTVDIGPAVLTPGTDAGPVDAQPDAALPTIQEATPVPEGEVALGELTSTEQVITPRLPSVPQPDQRHIAAAVAVEPSPAVVPPGAARPRRRRSRRGLKLVMLLLVVAGLVAAGVVFGRPYLFPGDWDEATAPYADAVESVRGTAFAEPLALVSEPTAAYGARLADELGGSWEEAQPQWRALGLATAPPDDTRIADELGGWRSAFYSTDDGQVYRDDAAVGPAVDAQVTQAMAAAALDQEFGWSYDQAERTLDDAALTTAEVIRQARAIQVDGPHPGPDEPVDATALAGLPSIVRYQALAPYLFAEFDLVVGGGDVDAGDGNVLQNLDASGPGPLPTEVPSPSSAPQMVGSDVVSTAGVAMDRSFWFLVLVGFLDPLTAYNASEAVVENSLTIAERGATTCAYGTFSGGGLDETAVLRGALESWSSAAPAEFASSFSVLDDGSLQLVSCDPGHGFESPVRPDADRALAAWRIAELATIEAIQTTGSNDRQADFDFAWPFVVASPLVTDLMAMPIDASPQDMAAAGRAAVAAIFAPAG